MISISLALLEESDITSPAVAHAGAGTLLLGFLLYIVGYFFSLGGGAFIVPVV